MSKGGDVATLTGLLARRLALDNGGDQRTYSHVTAPPVSNGALGVPDVVVPFLTITDGADLFNSDDKELEEWGIPTHAAVLYDRSEIEHWTVNLRAQISSELQEWRQEGGLSEERAVALVAAVGELWVIGATIGGDSFVVESFTATSIRVWPHATLLSPFVDPEDAPEVDGLPGLFSWLEAEIQRAIPE